MFKTLAPIILVAALLTTWAVHVIDAHNTEARLSSREDARDQALWKLLATDKR